MTTEARDVATTFLACLERSQVATDPYRHWLLTDALPDPVCRAVTGLPFVVSGPVETYGRRETLNASRIFFGAENQDRYPVCRALAAGFQDQEVTGSLARRCGVDLAGTFLRIEYCQDTDGFWLEPHTDIGVKKFTMLLYLSEGPGAETLGTDIYDGEKRRVETAPCRFNSGLIFIPASDTWHGFEKRPIEGVRKSLIINYVSNEWRSRHELAFPDRPVP